MDAGMELRFQRIQVTLQREKGWRMKAFKDDPEKLYRKIREIENALSDLKAIKASIEAK